MLVDNVLSDITLLLGQVFWLTRFYSSYVHTLIQSSLTGNAVRQFYVVSYPFSGNQGQ